MADNIAIFKNLEDQVRYQIPSAGASYLLDTYPAFAAYSTRQLSSTATNCMIVTEDGGGTEAIIGFSAGWLDEAAIATHCGASTGSVAQWYDQQDTLHAAMITDSKQPEIYNGTSVYQQNGKPSLYGASAGSRGLVTGAFTPSAYPNTFFTVNSKAAIGERESMIWASSPLNSLRYEPTGTIDLNAGISLFTSATYGAGQRLVTALTTGNNTNNLIRVNGTQAINGNCGNSSFGTPLYLMNNQFYNDGLDYAQEVIIYSDNQTANFVAIEADINSAFSIYA